MCNNPHRQNPFCIKICHDHETFSVSIFHSATQKVFFYHLTVDWKIFRHTYSSFLFNFFLRHKKGRVRSLAKANHLKAKVFQLRLKLLFNKSFTFLYNEKREREKGRKSEREQERVNFFLYFLPFLPKARIKPKKNTWKIYPIGIRSTRKYFQFYIFFLYFYFS